MACIFLFLSLRSVSLFKKSQNYFELFYLSFVQKPWFKFKYLNQFPKLPDLKSPQKVYLSLS
jgi:hypothetical protein